MKKLKVLAIMLAMVLCFGVFAAFVGCNNDDDTPDPTPSGSTEEVPVVDGKVTLYFTLAEGSVEIPEYGAVFYAGGLTGWDTTGAPAFTKLADKNVYYLQIEVDKSKDQWDEYQLVLGYSEASGLPADKQGIVWNDNLKSDQCAEVAYPDNPKYVLADGAKTVNLGTHKFSTELSAPETVSKVELRVTFSTPLEETQEVYFMGGFNDWDSTKAKATANTDRTMYSLELKDILCTDYEYKILVMDTGDGVVTKDAEDKDLGVWDQYFAELPANAPEGAVKVMARTEVSANGDNLSVKIIKRDNNSSVDLADTNSTAGSLKGLNLGNAVLTEGKTKDEAGNEVGNGVYTRILSLAGTKTLKVEFETALPADVDLYIIGNFLDSGWKTTVGQARMVIASDRMSASIDYEVLPKLYEFNMVFVHKNVELPEDSSNNVQPIWDNGVKASGPNLSVEVEGYEDGVVDLVTDKLTVPTVPNPDAKATNVTLKVTFATAVAADKHVVISGEINGWGATEMTADTERKVFTLTIPEMTAKTYGFKVSVSDDTTMNWNNAWGADGVYGGGNASFTVGEANSNTTVELFAAALVTPAN